MLSILLSILLAFLFLILSYAVGKRFLLLFSFPTLPRELLFLFSPVLGAGFFSIFFFFFGLFYLYSPLPFIILFFVLSVLLFQDILTFFSDASFALNQMLPQRKSFIIYFFFFTLSLFIFANFFFSLTPEIQWDSLVYHLTQTKHYASHHGIIELPYDYHTYMPKHYDIIFVLGDVFHIPQTSKIFTFLFNLFLVFGIFFFVQRHWGYTPALFSSTLFYTIPTLAIYQSTTYNDLPATLFIFCSCFAFLLSFQNSKFLYLTGIFLGFAAATKILFISFLSFFIFSLFIFLLFMKRQKFSTFVFNTLTLSLLTFLFVTPWLVLTYTQTGNPLYPFFYSALGGEHWSASLEDYWSLLRADYGSGRSLSSFFFSIWHITMHPMRYGPVYGITPLFLLFLPLLLFPSFKQLFFAPEKKRILLFFLSFSFFYFVVWFFLASDIRYLFPLFPGLTILSVVIACSILHSSYMRTKRLVSLILVLILLTNIFFFFVSHRNTLQLLTSFQDTDNYIHSYVQNYPMAQWVNTNLPPDALLFIANDDRAYFYDIPYILGYPIIQGIIDYPSITSASELRTALLAEGVTHVVLVRHHTPAGPTYTTFEHYYNDHITALWLDLTAYGKLIHAEDDVFLYTLE